MPTIQLIVFVSDNHGHRRRLTFRPPIPASLLSDREILTPAEEQAHYNYVHNTVQSYNRQILQTEPFRCITCGSKAVTMVCGHRLQLLLREPFVRTHARTVCNKDSCMHKARIESSQEEERSGYDPALAHFEGNMHACEVCQQTQNTKKCGRCKAVAYCGLDCQRKHWPQHKRLCKPSKLICSTCQVHQTRRS